MRWKQIEYEPKSFALIFETGDEIAGVLQQFSKSQGLGGSSLKPSARFLTRSWVGSTAKQESMTQPAFSTSKWNCFRLSATSPSRTESRRCTRTS